MGKLNNIIEESDETTIPHIPPYGVDSALKEEPFYEDSRFQTQQIYFLKNEQFRKGGAFLARRNRKAKKFTPVV